MATSTIRFVTQADDVISDLINLVDWFNLSHVEWVDDGFLTATGSHAKGGFQTRPINYAKFSNEEWYQITLSDENKVLLEQFKKEQIGKPYDFSAVAGNLTHRDWRCPDHWFCSEVVTAGFETANTPMLHTFDKHVNRITPRDLYLSTLLIHTRMFPIPKY